MMTSGVATPSVASSNIAVVITSAATSPASKPAKIALVLLMMLPILPGRFRATSIVASLSLADLLRR